MFTGRINHCCVPDTSDAGGFQIELPGAVGGVRMLRLLSRLSCDKPNRVNSAASQGNVIQHGRLALSHVTMAASDSARCLCLRKPVSPLPQKGTGTI